MNTIERNLVDLLPVLATREDADPEAYPRESVDALYDAGLVAAPFASDCGDDPE